MSARDEHQLETEQHEHAAALLDKDAVIDALQHKLMLEGHDLLPRRRYQDGNGMDRSDARWSS